MFTLLGSAYVRRVLEAAGVATGGGAGGGMGGGAGEDGLGTTRPYQRITDKFLANFTCLGLIHLALPNARFIHSRRAAVETCLSCFSRLFDDVPFSYDLGELGRYWRAYDAVMAHWARVLPPGVILEVR